MLSKGGDYMDKLHYEYNGHVVARTCWSCDYSLSMSDYGMIICERCEEYQPEKQPTQKQAMCMRNHGLACRCQLKKQTRKPCLKPSKYNGESCPNEEYCNNCREWWSYCYPQGWSYYAGDICEHGVYTGGCGIDWMCFRCEME